MRKVLDKQRKPMAKALVYTSPLVLRQRLLSVSQLVTLLIQSKRDRRLACLSMKCIIMSDDFGILRVKL